MQTQRSFVLLHEFVQTLHKFSKIKYVLNLFLWNLLKINGAKINHGI